MSKPPDNVIKLSDTLTLCEYTSPRSGHFGFWLYDKTRGMNLAIRAKSEREAFLEALAYYQKRLADVEQQHRQLTVKVNSFVSLFVTEDDNDGYN